MSPNNNEITLPTNPATNLPTINTPEQENFNTEAMQGSFQQILSENLGVYVIIDFLIGTAEMVSKKGYLYSVGRGVVTIYEDTSDTYITCDVFSVKFVRFFPLHHVAPLPVTPHASSPVSPAPNTNSAAIPASMSQTSRMRRNG